MNIKVDRDTSRIFVYAEEISLFARSKRRHGRPLFDTASSSPADDADYKTELSCPVSRGNVSFVLLGTADLVYKGEKIYTIELMKARQQRRQARPGDDPGFFAHGVLLSYMLASQREAEFVRLRLTYTYPSAEPVTDESVFSFSFLEKSSNALLDRAIPFIAAECKRRLETLPSLALLPFPYPSVREAQRDFINDCYRAIKLSSKLLVCAPTGIGKTVSALYPALRAIGSGDLDKIFYLTAKTVTGKACEDACRQMSQNAKGLRCVTVMAKERTCPMAGTHRASGLNPCHNCPLMGEVDRRSYEERRDSALLCLLDGTGCIDSSLICRISAENSICPYELSLDVSEYCEVIICDYNYAFDPSVRFKRYFSEKRQNYAFLVDEAHNLPDRAREMYSASLDTKAFIRLYKTDSPVITKDPPLLDGIGAVIKKLREITALCKSEEHMNSQGESTGYYLSSRLPEGLTDALVQFSRAAQGAIKKDEEAAVLLSEAASMASDFVKSATLFDRGFAFYAELYGPRLTLSSRCLDPSPLLSSMLLSAKSTVMFSATLTPMDYFADVLGCTDGTQLELDSPYDKKNLCLFACDHISTRYEDRELSIPDITEVILAVTEAKEGNYMVYFPSYEYMEQVYEEFSQCAPHINAIKQSQSMTHRDRVEFLSRFTPDGEPTVGFCVLGGAFSEGVDLRGDCLIGAVIVGTGLSRITAEQNILADYFEKTREGGYDYAYTYPGMIKVQQAAGRVIRSEKDRGVVVLIDDRYSTPNIYRLFPKAWSHIKYTGDPYSLSVALESFWNEK